MVVHGEKIGLGIPRLSVHSRSVGGVGGGNDNLQQWKLSMKGLTRVEQENKSSPVVGVYWAPMVQQSNLQKVRTIKVRALGLKKIQYTEEVRRGLKDRPPEWPATTGRGYFWRKYCCSSCAYVFVEKFLECCSSR